MITFSRSILARKTELSLKLYGETLKTYPQVKFLGITFDSQLSFKKHFEDILDHCNTMYHRLRLLTNKKWGPSQATLIQIYKQCVRPIFEYGSLSSDYIISKIQWFQNKFIRLALRLPKYICTKLLHDSTGLPYVKDRFLSCTTKSVDRIAQNLLVEESISSNRLSPAWDYPMLKLGNKTAKTNPEKAQLFVESVKRNFGIESHLFRKSHFDCINKFVEAHSYHFTPLDSLNDITTDTDDDSDLVADVDPDTLIRIVRHKLKNRKAPGI